MRAAGGRRPADQARASELLDAASALRRARLHLGARRRHERRAVPHQARRSPRTLPEEPVLPPHQQQSRTSAPAHRPFAAIRISCFRRPQGARRHRLHGLYPQLRDGFLARHGRLMVDRRGRRLQRRHDRRAAQDPEPPRRGGQDGRARPARRQHAHHLSRRRRRAARAERPDQARRRRNHPLGAGHGRHAQIDAARRKGGPASLHRHAQPVLRRDRRAVQPRWRRNPQLPRRRLPRRLSVRTPQGVVAGRLPRGASQPPSRRRGG